MYLEFLLKSQMRKGNKTSLLVELCYVISGPVEDVDSKCRLIYVNVCV